MKKTMLDELFLYAAVTTEIHTPSFLGHVVGLIRNYAEDPPGGTSALSAGRRWESWHTSVAEFCQIICGDNAVGIKSPKSRDCGVLGLQSTLT